MKRITGIVLLLLALCVGLPPIAAEAHRIVRPLLAVLVLLVIVSLALPPNRHR